jgi:adenine-specific DNA-methyltransferase
MPKLCSNLLIQGDNLNALFWLKNTLTFPVDFIYIDPPFNTGNKSMEYDDELTHEKWLAMIKERVLLSLELLRDGGALAVHLNRIEQPYMRVLLDSILGRQNLVSQISWQRGPDRTLLGQGSTLINDSVEYIIIYSKGPLRKDLVTPQKQEPISWKTLGTYSKVLWIDPDKKLVASVKDHKGNVASIFQHHQYSLTKIETKDLIKVLTGSWKELDSLFGSMIRVSNQQKESTFQRALIEYMKTPNTLYSAEYYQSKGKHRGNRTRYYINGQVVLFLKDTATLVGNRIFKISDLNNFWTHDEVPSTGIAKEGGVSFRRGKKPERLLMRLIDCFTKEGELVLDYFAGSGTTGAVAHKMRRKWIMVEKDPKTFLLCLSRLRSVVEGKDKSGITKDVGWTGGGDFEVIDQIQTATGVLSTIKKGRIIRP